MALFTKDDLVWAKSSAIKQVYWPAKVIDMDYSLTHREKKPVLACVQFLVEQTYEAITDGKRLLPFNCQQKSVFLNKGQGLKDPCKRLQFDNAVILAEQEINRLEKNDLYKMSRVKSILDGDVIQNESVLAKKRSATSSLRVPRIPSHKVRKLDSEETKSSDETANDNTARLHTKPEQKTIKGTKRTKMHSCVDEENDSNHVDCSNKHDRSHELTDGLDERHKRKTPYRTKTRRKKTRCQRSVMFDSGIGLRDGENLKGEETEDATDVRASMADSSLYGFNMAPNRNGEDDMSLERITNRVVSSGEEAKVGKRMDIKDACLNDECESCQTALGHDGCGKKESEGNGQQNGVEEQAVTLDNLKTCSCSDEESDSELPEAFSPLPGAEGLCFRQGDVVWVRFKRLPYWPSQVARIAGRRNPTHYYICFLPKQERKCIKINKKNIVSFTDPEVYERNKKQDVDATLREEFEQALKEAEDILVRRVSFRDTIFFSDDKDLSVRSTNSDENPHSFFDVAESADTASQREGGEQLGTTAEDKVLSSEDSTTPERRKGVRQRRSVSKYNDILLGFHQCKSRLLKIYGEKVQCDRHRKFRYGTTAEKDFLKHRSGFGPIQDDKICEQIVDILKAWYKELTQKEFLQLNYIFDVWLPEAIIFCIQIKENVNRRRAEKMYLDYAKNTRTNKRMAAMNVGSGSMSSQDDIAREVASAIADENSSDTAKDASSSGSAQNIPHFVSSESGSFVRISTSSEHMVSSPVQSATSPSGAVALNFGDESGTTPEGQGTSGGSGVGTGVWGWISNAVGGDIVETTQRLGRNLVQKTKTSMDSVITTLDPGMEDYLNKTGADCVNVFVTSTDEDIFEGVKDGFKQVFEHVFVKSQPSRSSLAPLPNSFSSALKSARQRITNLQSSSSEVGVITVAVEEFIVEIMPEMWFGMMCLCLDDSSRKLETETFSQGIALSNDVVKKLEELTPSHYSLRWSGLSVSLVDVLQNNWTKFLTGIPKRQVVTLAAKTLAGQYREAIQRSSSVMQKSITL